MPRKSLHSAALPPGFFAPAVNALDRSLSPAVEKRFHYLQTASVSLLRVIAIGAGGSWLLLLCHSPDQLFGPEANIWKWLLVFASAAVFLAGVFRIESWYRWLMGLAAVIYLLLLAAHSAFLLIAGGSPLGELRLGDYSAIPAALFVATWPTRVSIIVALTAVAISAAFNLGTPPGYRMLLEVMHALAPVLPFVVVVANGLKTTRTIDEVAARVHRDAVVMAGQQALIGLETRFLAFIHDHVLTQLSAFWRGTVPPDPRRLLAAIADTGIQTPESITEITIAEVVNQITEAVLSENPDTEIIAPDGMTDATGLPATAVSALVDAIRQGSANVAKHARGSRAQLSFQLAPGRFRALLIDDGPGFTPSELSADRAGIRVSILGRLEQTHGCSGEVISAPGQGCRVAVEWNPHPDDRPDEEADTLPSVHESMGLTTLFRPGPAVMVWLLFLGLSLTNDHPRPVLWAISLVAAAIALWCLIQQRQQRLPSRYVYAAFVAVWIFYASALGENAADESTSPFFWAPWVAVLLCAYLAMRNRPLAGWAAWIGCLVIAQMFVWNGVQTMYIAPATSWIHSLVLLPASILPWMVKRISDGLPLLLGQRRSLAKTQAVTMTQQRFLDDARNWLDTRIRYLFSGSLSTQQKVFAAHIFEQRLRDSIRSPLLDRPVISAATWDARLRGVTVKLLDDYSTDPDTDSTTIDDDVLWQVEAALSGILELAGEGDTVVARLLPPGRSSAATILYNNESTGEVRRITILPVQEG